MTSSSSSSRLLALTAASTIIYSLYHRYYNRSDSGKKKHDNDDGKLDDDDDWGKKKTKKKKGNNYDNDDKNKIQEQQQQQPILPEHLQREIYKEERRKKSIRFLSMKKPLYDNIEMYHPDNITMLCTIGKKKANWYVKKQLAVWRRDEDAVIVNNENEKNDDDDDVHPSIRLLFEPKNSKNCKINREKIMAATAISTNDDDGNTFERMNTYNINHKKNICVACGMGPDAPSSSSKSKSTVACNNNGKEDHEDHDDGDMEEGDDGGGGGLMRHYVVPYSYRKKFPIKFKTHLPHDIVLLCIECHIGMNQATKIYRTDIYEQSYRTDPNTRLKVIVDEKLKHIKSYSRALHLYKDKLPKQRIQLYENYILKEYVLINNQNKNDANDIHNNNISNNNNNNNNNTDDNNDDDKLDVIIKASNSTATTTTTTGAMTLTTETVANETKMTTTTTIIPDDTLRQLSENLITEKLNPKYIPLVDLVMKHKLKTDQDVREFVIGWRQFFVDTLNPQYLPIGWSINSPVEIDDNDES
jgi:hypothetical protein